MNPGKIVFSQLTSYLPIKAFRRCVNKYNGNRRVRHFSCWDQFLSMAFAQLTYRESLRDIESCLRSMQPKLYHMGIRGKISRSTLADANEKRDWRIYADFAQILIHHARKLYHDDSFGVDLENTVYALDSTTVDLCLSLFPWAVFRKTKGAVKLHTLLDLRGNIPAYLWITEAKVHDVNILDELIPEPGSFYILDRGYIDFQRLFTLNKDKAHFVIRAKRNLKFKRIYSHPINKSTGLKCDQTIVLPNYYTSKDYPEKLRRVKFYDAERDKDLVFLTNNFNLDAMTICELYKYRWQIEIFFKWIKQNLRIKSFYGTTPNAVKTQIWIAISVYVLVAIVKKQLKLSINLYTFLQILSVSIFETVPIFQLVTSGCYNTNSFNNEHQLLLFDL
jgi:hypothetical protein